MVDFDDEEDPGESPKDSFFKGPSPYVVRGELSLTDEGIQHYRVGILLKEEDFHEPAHCMDVLDKRFVLIDDFLFLLYVARHAFNRGRRDRAIGVTLPLRERRKAFRRVPGTNIYLDAETDCFRDFVTFDDAQYISSELMLAPQEEDYKVVELAVAKADRLKKLRATASTDLLDLAKVDVMEHWRARVGEFTFGVHELTQLLDHLARYSPQGIKDAMDLANARYFRKSAQEQFDKIGSFLGILEQSVEEPQAEEIHKAKHAVFSQYWDVSELEAVRFLRTASYLGISIAALRDNDYSLPLSRIQKAIRNASVRPQLEVVTSARSA